MRLVFMGTPEFAATILEDLVQHHDVVAVYTRPDAVRGRGKGLVPSPVKQLAERLGLQVMTPETLRDAAVQREIASFNPDVICVAAYGALLPKAVLGIPRFGCLNVHGSLLPSWRGAAPIERAILAGDRETGVCVMKMEEGLDTGDYCVCRTTNIDGKTAEELSDELANLGSHALLTALIHLQEDAIDWTVQDDASATYAEKIEKGELDPDPRDGVSRLLAKVRASSPAHPARCIIAGRPVTVLKLADIGADPRARGLTSQIAAGEVLYRGKRLFLGAADGAVEVIEVKPDGKQAMDAKAFAAGIQGLRTDTLNWTSLDAR